MEIQIWWQRKLDVWRLLQYNINHFYRAAWKWLNIIFYQLKLYIYIRHFDIISQGIWITVDVKIRSLEYHKTWQVSVYND